jgi:hypothetical protein
MTLAGLGLDSRGRTPTKGVGCAKHVAGYLYGLRRANVALFDLVFLWWLRKESSKKNQAQASKASGGFRKLPGRSPQTQSRVIGGTNGICREIHRRDGRRMAGRPMGAPVGKGALRLLRHPRPRLIEGGRCTITRKKSGPGYSK